MNTIASNVLPCSFFKFPTNGHGSVWRVNGFKHDCVLKGIFNFLADSAQKPVGGACGANVEHSDVHIGCVADILRRLQLYAPVQREDAAGGPAFR